MTERTTPLRDISLPAICYSRMEEWAKQLAERNCTPVLVMGIGHQANSGEVHLFTMQDFSDDDLQMFLAFAQSEIRKRRGAA
jgi:hypothetical protein